MPDGVETVKTACGERKIAVRGSSQLVAVPQLEEAEAIAEARLQLMNAIAGCEDCQAMEAEGRIMDCTAFCGDK